MRHIWLLGVLLWSISGFAGLTASFEQLVSQSKTAPVPQRVQIDGTCGLYALGMVMDYWHAVSSANPTYWVQEQDQEGRGVQYNYDPSSPEKILDYVKRSEFSRAGEMFEAADLAKTAIHFGYQATYYPRATLEDIYRILDKKHPVIVAFDVDDYGNPGLFGGMRAHYAVLEGYFDYQNTRYLIAKHGWGTQSDYIWRANLLYASMKNLKRTACYSSPNDVPKQAHLCPVAGRPELEGIAESLGDKIIEVVPLGEALVGGVAPN